ncbi:MAG: hypothetical protein KBB35_01015 [Bacteroidales bacterium]|nr:hypothetical protein [Bacteroidales bacterium]
MRYRCIDRAFFLILTLFAASSLMGQDWSAEVRRAQALHNSYDFYKALDIWHSLLERSNDSLQRIDLLEKIVRSENGRNMLGYATEPRVLSSLTVPRNDFFLWYSHLEEKSWLPIPNAFVPNATSPHEYYTAIYYPEGIRDIVFSSQDESGSWNLYTSTCSGDTLWRYPTLINENLTSPEDDIFPILSHNGRELYFSTKGLFGMGGYDLFVSRWDEEINDWGIPENLGFPYSSPFDDFLFCHTPDGNFSLFASNRSCHRDSMTIYVLEFENKPIKKPITSLEQARNIAALIPIEKDLPSLPEYDEGPPVASAMDSLFLNYTSLLANLRGLQDSLIALGKDLEMMRELYTSTENEQELQMLSTLLLNTEHRAIVLRSEINSATSALQQMEMKFLMEGIIINLEDISEKAQETNPVEEKQYPFVKRSFSKPFDIPIEIPKESFDYSFRILDTAVIAEPVNIPGISYSIQLSVTSHKAQLRQLKGFSPVFEKRQSSGKYLYTAGIFHSYQEALSQINIVRKRGFPTAFLVAYRDGKSISVNEARQAENLPASGPKYCVVLENFAGGIPDAVMAIIRNNTSKEVVRSLSEGKVLYIMAPFDKKEEAETFADILKGNGVEGIITEQIK